MQPMICDFEILKQQRFSLLESSINSIVFREIYCGHEDRRPIQIFRSKLIFPLLRKEKKTDRVIAEERNCKNNVCECPIVASIAIICRIQPEKSVTLTRWPTVILHRTQTQTKNEQRAPILAQKSPTFDRSHHS